MGDVDQELVAGADRVGQVDRRQGIAFHQDVVGRVSNAVGTLHHDHGEAMRALDQIAIGVGRQQRHVEHVRVGQVEAEDVARLGLDDGPGRHAADLDVVGRAKMAIAPERCGW